MVASPNLGFRFQAATPVHAAAAPTGGGGTPRWGPNGAKRPNKRRFVADWGRMGRGRGAADPRRVPFWAMYGCFWRKRVETKNNTVSREGQPPSGQKWFCQNMTPGALGRFTGHVWAVWGPF